MNHPGGLQPGSINLHTAIALDHIPRTRDEIIQIVSEDLGRPVHPSSVSSALTRLVGYGCAVRVGVGLWAEPDDALSEVRRCPT